MDSSILNDKDKMRSRLEADVIAKLKAKNIEIVKKMHLYFGSTETEIILHSRIKSNVIEEVKLLYQIVANDTTGTSDGIGLLNDDELSSMLLEPYKWID